jgi:hypothetical protein
VGNSSCEVIKHEKLHRLVCVVAVISPSGKEEGFEKKVSYSRDAVIEFETTTLLAFIGALNPTDANILFFWRRSGSVAQLSPSGFCPQFKIVDLHPE